jgi:nucleoside-diphosphate-sugar epimerase
MKPETWIIKPDEPVLVTGATGFIGPAVVESLFRHGIRQVRALARPSSDLTRLLAVAQGHPEGTVQILRGNLLSREDCRSAAQDAAVIFHLATSGDKSFANSFMNSVVTTRNLLESSMACGRLRRFVNVSSFAVYTNADTSWRVRLQESSQIETHAERRGDAYCFAKVKQDELVADYGRRFGIPYVIVRPGSVFGPGKQAITGRVGIDTFGIFLHLGGSNRIPFTYIDNCADAIVLAGLKPGVDGEIFNVVDDNLPTSRHFLSLYKHQVGRFRSVYIPHALSYAICTLWEKYSIWSQGQLPPAFNRRRWRAEWRSTRYSNQKLKERLGWEPRVPMSEGLNRFFQSCREARHA